MERAKGIIVELASASQSVISAGTEHANRKGFRNVHSCHFRLEKEMQKIRVAAEGMLEVLHKSSLPNGPALDDRLQEWFSTDDLPTCLDTLDEMKRMLQDNTWMNTVFNFVNTLRPSPPEDKINAAVKLFDSRRNYFHSLLTTDVWNCEEPQQHREARASTSAQARGEPTVELTLETNSDATEVEMGNHGVANTVESLSLSTNGRKTNDLRTLDDILRWLDGLNCAVKQEETMSLHQPGTCTWLNSTPEYKTWRNSDDSFFWLQGKPGSGKTVLASFVVDSLKSNQPDEETLAYFFCDFRNDRSTSAAEVMRSLLSQLLRHIRNGDIDSGELIDSLVKEKDGDTPILKNAKNLATFVSQAAKQFSHQPLVVIDALDECQDVEKLLDCLLILTKGGMRLFVTSRPIQIIKDGLRDLPSIPIDKMAAKVSTDIALHVTRELDSRRRLRDLELCLKMEVHSVLCDRADGMFRWVQCQIDTLNQCTTRAEVREALNNLPIGLDETYQRILVAIDAGSPEGKLALRVLVWLVGALRPLRLLEILEGLTLDIGRRTVDLDNAPLHKGALLDACSSLVTYNEETDVLILSHFSVKEYLTGDLTRIKLPRYHISYQGAHEHLARLCICYLSLYLEHIHRSDETPSSRIMRTIHGRSHNAAGKWSYYSENPPVALSMSQELLSYVFSEGFNHLAYLGSANHVVLKDMATLQSSMQRHHDAWEVVHRKSQRYKLQVPWPDQKHDFILYVLIAFASGSLLHAFLGHSRKVLKPKHQTNPLIYAAHFGKIQHAQMLLSRGVKVNDRGLVIDTFRQQLPIEVAVSRQHDTMVDLLLSSGSVVPNQLFAFITNNNFPIRIARRLLQTDEFTEWALGSRNRLPSPVGLLERRPPLSYEGDIIIMIHRLVQVGLDPAACNSARKTALHLAIAGGYLSVAVYLVLIGAEVDGEDTALHLVMKTLEQDKCLEAVKILVDAGCKPFAHNRDGKTPLRLAFERRYFSVADYLLSQQWPAPLDLLSIIVESGRPVAWVIETTRALINGGADIHGVTVYGDSLLHRAVTSLDEHEGLEMAKFLVSVGCDPFSRNSMGGWTPLDIALDRRLAVLADYLLSTGKPLPSNALLAILSSTLPKDWRLQKMSSLIDRGANLCEVSVDGDTLLHVAVRVLSETQGLYASRLLVGVGCASYARNKTGKTPLQIALDRKLPLLADYLLSIENPLPSGTLFAMLCSALPIAWRANTLHRYLVDRMVDITECSEEGDTLLHTAVSSLDDHLGLDVAKHLVGAGCAPCVRNKAGKTPLLMALERGHSSIADYLLYWIDENVNSAIGEGADIHSITADGNILTHAVMTFHTENACLERLSLLVSRGFKNTSARNKEGKTALHIAVEKEYTFVIRYILSLDQPLPDDILFFVLKLRPRRIPFMLCLLIDKANIHATVDGDTILHAAISSFQNIKTVFNHSYMRLVTETLVDCGCDAFSLNSRGQTPLHLAVAKDLSIVRYLLPVAIPQCLPPDILACALCGRAARTNWEDIRLMLWFLIGKGASVRVRATHGGGLLHMVIKEHHLFQNLHPALSISPSPSPPLALSPPPTPRLSRSPLLASLSESAAMSIDNYDSSHTSQPHALESRLGRQARPECVDDYDDVWDWAEVSEPINRPRGNENMPLQIIKFLVESGCDPSQCDAEGHQPVYYAALVGDTNVVEYLLPRTVPLPQNLPDPTEVLPWDPVTEWEAPGKWEFCI